MILKASGARAVSLADLITQGIPLRLLRSAELEVLGSIALSFVEF